MGTKWFLSDSATAGDLVDARPRRNLELKRTGMTTIDGNALHVTDRDVDALTWEFLTSDDAGDERVDEPLDRRLDRFLRDRGLGRLADSADIRNILLHRAMTYVRVLAR
jgi:hypothetical protein